MESRYKVELVEDKWYQAELFGEKMPYDIKIDGSYRTRYKTWKGKPLNTHINGWGYHCVHFRINGKGYHKFLHTVLAHTFLTLPEGYDYKDLTVNHRDGNKLNNNLENLEWCTFQANQIHKFDYDLQKSTRGPVDHSVYLFRHDDGREYIGTPRELYWKFKEQDRLFQQGIRSIVKGYNTSNGNRVTQHKGWRMIELLEKAEERTLERIALYNPVPKPLKTY